MSFMHVWAKQGETAFSSLVVMLLLLQVHHCQEKKNDWKPNKIEDYVDENVKALGPWPQHCLDELAEPENLYLILLTLGYSLKCLLRAHFPSSHPLVVQLSLCSLEVLLGCKEQEWDWYSPCGSVCCGPARLGWRGDVVSGAWYPNTASEVGAVISRVYVPYAPLQFYLCWWALPGARSPGFMVSVLTSGRQQHVVLGEASSLSGPCVWM